MRRFAPLVCAGLLLMSVAQTVAAAPPDKATLRALDEAAKIEVVKMPLADVMKRISQQHKVPITIDERALSNVGIPTDEPLTLSIEGITLRSALNLLLNEYSQPT